MDRKAWAVESQEHKVEDFYGQGAEAFGDFHNGYLNFGLWEPGIVGYLAAAENLVHRIGTMLALDSSSRLLDIAPGMGTQDLYLADKFKPAGIDAVDITWKHVEQARERVRKAGREGSIRVHHASAVELPFPPESFTHVMSIEGPEHFDTRDKFFGEAFRVLEPGGVMALSDYTLRREPKNWLEKTLLGICCGLWHVPKENRYSARVYRERVERAGFVNVSIDEVGEKVIPGYCFEQFTPECRRELAKIRGFVAGRLGIVIDIILYKAYTSGLIDYVLVRAEKPA